MDQQDDIRLIQRIAARDPDAMQSLYDRYAPRLMAIALRVLNDRSVAEELLGDVFFEIWQKADRFDSSRGSVSTYIFMLTRSRSIDRKRASGKMKLSSLQASSFDAPSSGTTPATAVVATEQTTQIRKALRMLEPAQRECIECSFFDGLSHSEIADKLNKPLGTVKTTIRNGLIRLRDSLRPMK